MISFDVHNVERVRPEIRHLSDFTMLYLHIEGKDIPHNTTIRLFCYKQGEPGELYQIDQPNVGMNLLNELGLEIERTRRESNVPVSGPAPISL